jgi:hypothetical protein
MKKLILAALVTLAAFSVAAADTIYMRNGTTLRGTVLGFVNGRFAIQVESAVNAPATPNNTQSNARVPNISPGAVVFLRPRDIDRIEIDGRSLDDARFQTTTVDVSLGANWIDSGVDLRRNERIRIDATGTIYAGRTRITPAGLSTTDPNAPLPRAAEGELIGVIGNEYNSPIIELGASREFAVERDGRLYLTVNRGSYVDARGAYNVKVRKEVDLNAMARVDDTRTDNRNDNYDPFGMPSDTGPARTRPRNTPGGVATRTNRTLERTIDVPGNQPRGIDTGIDLRAGDQVTITATGNVTAGRRAGVVSPEGGRAGTGQIFGASAYPVPTAGVGALIGYILVANGQASQPFYIGPQSTFTASTDGRLYLSVNDDNFSDNSGSFSVRIIYPDYR